MAYLGWVKTMDRLVYVTLAISSVLIANISQIILKKAATKHYDHPIKEYVNLPVIISYAMFVISTLLTGISLRNLPLSLTPLWQSLGQVMIPVLSYFFLKEKITRDTMTGVLYIIIGIIVFSF